MLRISILAFFCFLYGVTVAQLQAPDDFLPHKLGEQFTPHHMLVDYMEHVDDNSDNVILTRYGYTNEDRPLLMAFVSTPANLAKLERIRENNLRRAGFQDGDTDPSLDLAIVWLSFSVHGNEASGSEASMQVIYDLANPNNDRTQAWLQNTIVVIDPSINPDGYSRYTHWYRRVSSRRMNPDPSTEEFDEPWPGGRVNHYLFDLNRDWAWQTQAESRQRMAKFQQWLPHVHADLHEMGSNSNYYFAPAARPYHEYITDWQAEFQEEVGKNHAKYFDRNGWLYFTREVYDLLYPSYGDTYPIFHGGIGMTYEQAGHTGRGKIIDNGDTLTLKDRVMHHTASALSTVEVSSANAEKLIEEFEKYHKGAQENPPGTYKTYVIKGDNPTGRIKAFTDLLDKNLIQYGRAGRLGNYRGYDYSTGEERSFKIEEGDLLISAYQPKAVFTQILMEPQTTVEDSLTYDITAWSLPYAYGLQTFGLKEKMNVESGFSIPKPQNKLSEAPYAYVSNWNSLADTRFLSALLRQGVKVRFSERAFTLEGVSYAPGTLVITRSDNRKSGAAFDRIVKQTAQELEQPLRGAATGWTNSGSDFGARSMRFIQTPKIVAVTGEGTSSNSYGQVWHYLEQALDYPFIAVTVDRLSRLNLNDYNVLILPEGRYNIDNGLAEKLSTWVSGGGRIIAIGAANRILQRHDQLGLNSDGNSNNEKEDPLRSYGERVRRSVSRGMPGAIFKVKIDNSHPLGFGLDDYYFSLKTGSLHFPYQENAWNVGTIGKNPMAIGFVGSKVLEEQEESTVFAVKNRGRGAIIYLIDNPLFRGFWENGKFLFGNALFLAGQ